MVGQTDIKSKPNKMIVALIMLITTLLIASGFIFLRWPAGFIVLAAVGSMSSVVSYVYFKRLEYKILALLLFVISLLVLLLLPVIIFQRQ